MKKLLFFTVMTITTISGSAQNHSCNDLLDAIKSENISWIASQSENLNPNCLALGDGTPLIEAVRSENLEVVKAIVNLGADVNLGVKGDGSPLIEAAGQGLLEITKYLVQQGANINLHIMGDETPLIKSAWNGHLEIVKYLVSQGAEVNKTVRDRYQIVSENRNAIRMAKRENHQEIVQYLLKAGAKE